MTKKELKNIQKEINLGNLTISLIDEDIDEIFLDDINGNCMFHMERMSDNTYWMRFYHTPKNKMDKKDLVLWIGAVKHKISAEYTIEDFNDALEDKTTQLKE